MYTGNFYFNDENFKLINGDTFEVLKTIENKAIDLIFADPPYFLSNDGITCSRWKNGKCK